MAINERMATAPNEVRSITPVVFDQSHNNRRGSKKQLTQTVREKRHGTAALIRAATVRERFPREQAGRQNPPIKHPSLNSTNRFLTVAALIFAFSHTLSAAGSAGRQNTAHDGGSNPPYV